MAGDFGEVFLLDWGLAKLVEDSEVEDTSGRTRRGQILGTPGYMSPEQAVDAQSIDERTDVYSLGCILFEMLTHEPFLKGKNARELMRATQLGSMERASERAPQLDIPPELDDVCLKATQRDPDDRYTSVQQMREAIDRYLEGERDVGLRQRLAQRHLERADSIAGRADGSHEARHHAQAVREAGRALALDPENAQAQQLLMKLMLSAPDDIAESDQRRVHREAALLTEAKLAGGLAALAYGTFLVLLLAVAAFQGVRSTTGFLAVVIPLTVGVATATWRRRSDAPGSNLGVATHLAGTVAVAAAAGVAGAMILVPVLATANTLAFGTSVNLRPRRKLILGAGCLALLLPTVLEWAGWLPRIYSFENGQIVVTPTTLDLSPVVTPVALFLVSAAAIAVPLIAVWRISNELEDKRRQLHQRLWHLTQLLPQLQTVDRLTNPPFEAMAPARGPLSPR
jgi:serine/threonine-protein kinase